MTSTPAAPDLPVLWLCGPAGAGKSVTAWALFEALGDEGIHAAHVDIDQLGMLYPEVEDDPGRHRLKTETLAALLPSYAAAGARVLVVSGVVDPGAPTDLAARLPGARTTFCLLDVDDATLRQRLLDRGWDPEDADEAAADARALRGAPFVDEVVHATGCSVPDVVGRVRPLVALADTQVAPRADEPAPSRSSPSADLTVVSGARAVGSSTVGFGLARAGWRSGRVTGFVDLQQLAFLRRPGHPGHSHTALGIANVMTMHRHFAMRGAEQVIVSAHLDGPADHQAIRHAAPGGRVHIVRLYADAPTIAAHLRERSRGSEARLAGDDLTGASDEHQRQVLRVALAGQRVLDADPAEDTLVDVSARTVDDVVSEVQRRVSERSRLSAGRFPGA